LLRSIREQTGARQRKNIEQISGKTILSLDVRICSGFVCCHDFEAVLLKAIDNIDRLSRVAIACVLAPGFWLCEKELISHPANSPDFPKTTTMNGNR
jgi:hypothetical protein